MLVGDGHYLNSRIELGSGVLDLIRAHCDRLEQRRQRLARPLVSLVWVGAVALVLLIKPIWGVQAGASVPARAAS